MVDKNLIMIKTDKIKEYLGYLQDVRKHSLKNPNNNYQAADFLSRRLDLDYSS